MCSGCGGERDRNGRYCRACHNAYMREWRKTHPLTDAERAKANTRAYTKVLVARGRISKLPCRRCGAAQVHGHHPDYGNPWRVVWLCPPCHRAEHTRLRAAA